MEHMGYDNMLELVIHIRGTLIHSPEKKVLYVVGTSNLGS